MNRLQESAAMLSQRPPCWDEGKPCPNSCAAAHYDRVVLNHHDLHGAWTGWGMTGMRLVSPQREWITPHLLDRWLWRHGRMFADGRG